VTQADKTALALVTNHCSEEPLSTESVMNGEKPMEVIEALCRLCGALVEQVANAVDMKPDDVLEIVGAFFAEET
jgi:hypothetical protein